MVFSASLWRSNHNNENIIIIIMFDVLFFFFTDVAYAFDSHLRGPAFVMEPPSRLEFSNSSGGWLDCSASGSPQPSIDWLSVDGTSVGDVSGVRRVLRNGTLVLQPFAAAAYRQDIHSTVYRCVASNNVGRIVSRDVQVRAGKFLRNLFYQNWNNKISIRYRK